MPALMILALLPLQIVVEPAQDEDHAYMGITGATHDDGGVEVLSVKDPSPSLAAGIKVGDRITEFDHKKIDTMETLQALVKSKKIGDRVAIKLVREGRTIETEMILASRNSVDLGTYKPSIRPEIPSVKGERDAEKKAHGDRVTRLVSRLSDADFKQREGVMRELITLGPAVGLYLKRALRSGNLEVQTRARHVHVQVFRPIPLTRVPTANTRVVLPARVKPAGSLEEALKADKPIVVFSAPPCEFDCARLLSSGPLADPRVARQADAFTWVVVKEYGKTAEALRKRFKTERSVFVGLLDKSGAPIGRILDAETTADQLAETLKLALPR